MILPRDVVTHNIIITTPCKAKYTLAQFKAIPNSLMEHSVIVRTSPLSNPLCNIPYKTLILSADSFVFPSTGKNYVVLPVPFFCVLHLHICQAILSSTLRVPLFSNLKIQAAPRVDPLKVMQ